MKTILSTILILLMALPTVAVSNLIDYGKGVHNIEDYGAKPGDNIDDSYAFNAAFKALSLAGGGTIYIPCTDSGEYFDINQIVRLVPVGYVGGEVKITGEPGCSIVRVSVGTSTNGIAFYAGNLNFFTMEDFAIIGVPVQTSLIEDYFTQRSEKTQELPKTVGLKNQLTTFMETQKAVNPNFTDASNVIYVSTTIQTHINRVQIYGVATTGATIYLGNTDALIENSQFDGNAGTAVIESVASRGLTVKRATFLDYANFHGQYLSKSPVGIGAWIKVSDGTPGNANGQRRVVIKDSRFDEASAETINIKDMNHVSIKGVNANLNGTYYGRGIVLENIEHAEIFQSWFGYTTYSKPAITAINSTVEVKALNFGGGVYFLDNQNSTVQVSFCPSCN